MAADKPVWLFVAYGGGHIRSLLPVAQAARDEGLAQVKILALTTAAVAVRQAGFEPLGFADFVLPEDAAGIRHGRQLAQELDFLAVDPQETAAYLGLCYADLIERIGARAAEKWYADVGRQCFEPVSVLRRIIRRLAPELVVATSSPRAEKAAILAAGELQIPAVCVVDLFALEEKRWVSRPSYATRVCVLNEFARDVLTGAGRDASDIAITGNPAFDAILREENVQGAFALRERIAPDMSTVVLWAVQPEPQRHPSVPGARGDPHLPDRIRDALLEWLARSPDRFLVMRTHPSDPAYGAEVVHPRLFRDAGELPLYPLLHAIDAVVALNSTVGVEAAVAGKPFLQVLGSMFDAAAPFVQAGIASAHCTASDIVPVLESLVGGGPHVRHSVALAPQLPPGATKRVLEQLEIAVGREFRRSA